MEKLKQKNVSPMYWVYLKHSINHLLFWLRNAQELLKFMIKKYITLIRFHLFVLK